MGYHGVKVGREEWLDGEKEDGGTLRKGGIEKSAVG